MWRRPTSDEAGSGTSVRGTVESEIAELTGCGKALLEFPQPHPCPGERRKLYLRDTLRLPARGFAPLHTPNFSSRTNGVIVPARIRLEGVCD